MGKKETSLKEKKSKDEGKTCSFAVCLDFIKIKLTTKARA